MSIITVHCHLTAPESIRSKLWELTAEKNTPLINELLRLVAEQEEFDSWCQQGYLPPGLVQRLCSTLKVDDRFAGQPSRFYASAISHVEEIYKSYLQLQRQLRHRLQAQERWLSILKSDTELTELTGVSIGSIQSKAEEILSLVTSSSNIHQQLFADYGKTTNILKQAAIVYLLKNGCRIPRHPETPEQFARRLGKARNKIKQLQEEIDSHLPSGRDLDDSRRQDLLNLMDKTVPESTAQLKAWQDQLLKNPASVPYPITYGTNEDLSWGKDANGRLTVHFSGLSDMTFNVYCDQRQLKWFNRFYEDQQVKREGQNQHSSALFTLRSAMLGWSPHAEKGIPWNKNRLTLYCSLDTRLWSQEGTEIVRQEKALDVAKVLTKMQEKGKLSSNQEAFVKRKESTLSRLSSPFPRPSQITYQGSPTILLAVSMTLASPATVVIIDATTQDILAQRSFKQLLGKHYALYNRQQKQKHKLAHQRKQAQVKHQIIKAHESELGQQIDRILAKSIIELAMAYKVGSIVLPSLTTIRSSLKAEINARAEAKIPGCIEAQKVYAKQYKVSIHAWSYSRLQNCIASKASQYNLAIEYVELPTHKNNTIMLKEMALTAYKKRQVP